MSSDQIKRLDERLNEIAHLSSKKPEVVLNEHGGAEKFCELYFPEFIKPSNWKKYFLVTSLVVFLSFLVWLTYFIKSLTPIFSFNSDQKQFEFFGGRYKFPVFEIEYLNTNIAQFEKVYDLPNGKILKIDATRSQLYISMVSGDKVVANCFGRNQDNLSFIEEDGQLILNLNELTRCEISIPNDVPLKIDATAISLTLIGKIDKDFEIDIDQSMFIWRAARKYLCYLEIENESSVVEISPKMNFQKSNSCKHFMDLNGSYLKIYPLSE